MRKLFINIKQLLQVREEPISFLKGTQMKELPMIENAFLVVENDVIVDFGVMQNCPSHETFEVIDCFGKIVMPSFCDSHTHLVYAGNRSGEFVDRINGLSYEEIANKGGGILNSAKLLNLISEDELYEQSKVRLQEIISQGTGAVEIKSGYGLTVEGELKMLRVIKKLKENYPIEIQSTFLGAHAFPIEFKENQQAYVDVIVNEMIPAVSKENLANFVDVFLEKGYFSNEQAKQIVLKSKEYGLIAKIHVNQFNVLGGIQTSVELEALSVDHLEVMQEEDYKLLQNSKTMPVALPLCSYFIQIPYTPARKMLDEYQLPLALASDFNPGTTPSGNMHFVVATSCIQMKLTPEEAINAATINGAYAMNLSEKVGTITKGKLANLIITKPLHHYNDIPYYFGSNIVESVYLKGKKIA